MMRKAADWLISIQNADGGWGEDGASYKLDYRGYEPAPSTASQTAWALLGLMAAGEVDASGGRARHRTICRARRARDGLWDEERYTATGFPRVFYLRYHGYPKFFPLWALARYRNLKRANTAARGIRHVMRDAFWSSPAWRANRQIAGGPGVSRVVCSGGDPHRLRSELAGVDIGAHARRASASASPAGSLRRCGRATSSSPAR